MLLNEISVSDNSLGQLKIVTTNVQIMTLFGLKRIVLSSAKLFVLLCNPKLLCLSALSQLSCLKNVMLIMYYNVNFRINVLYIFSICNIFLMKLSSHHCLVPIYYIDFYILMYIYIHTVP